MATIDTDGTGPATWLLVKVAARCNIDCTYCYWFRDPEVLRAPKLLPDDLADLLMVRLRTHIARHQLKSFKLVLHGGEPLLWGRDRFRRLAIACADASAALDCEVKLAVTTNGVLVDDDWVRLLREFDFSVTVSLDGPAHIHDRRRRTRSGQGTHARVRAAIERLTAGGINVGVLAVCDPHASAAEFVTSFAGMGLDAFDILLPDATADEQPASISPFYDELVDLWFERNAGLHRLRIRGLESMILGLLGGVSRTEAVGLGPMEVVCVTTAGAIEPHDVLRILGSGATRTDLNIVTHELDAIRDAPRWRDIRASSLRPSAACQACRYLHVCGGGHLAHRYSRARGFDNPSVYCRDLFHVFERIEKRIADHVTLLDGAVGQP